eukprot:scaffold10093_cov104-Isochrysis_galbana.AAC.7
MPRPPVQCVTVARPCLRASALQHHRPNPLPVGRGGAMACGNERTVRRTALRSRPDAHILPYRLAGSASSATRLSCAHIGPGRRPSTRCTWRYGCRRPTGRLNCFLIGISRAGSASRSGRRACRCGPRGAGHVGTCRGSKGGFRLFLF